jgi:lysozyme family protein
VISWEVAHDRLMGSEGGFQKNLNDRGNWTSGVVGVGLLKGTKFGISAMSYPDEDIENMTRERAKELFFRDWWKPLWAVWMPDSVVYLYVDTAYHSGVVVAAKLVQRAARVTDDGKIGRVTRDAVAAMDPNDLAARMVAARLRFMTKTAAWKENSAGFANRIADVLDYFAEDN